MYEKILNLLKEKPMLYAKSTAPFWDDDHISKGMLAAHLNPDFEAASRKHDFIQNSVDWIAGIRNTQDGNKLLDLGCGPGIYAEKLYNAGFVVTGIDYSKRSINYAIQKASYNHADIKYLYQNYCDIDYENEFDLVTLIYCDFGVLPPADRAKLLVKIKRALKADGTLILDGFTDHQISDFSEARAIEYAEQGFWSPMPYILIQSNYLYPETKNYLEQYIVITDNDCQCYNNWNQVYSMQSIGDELQDAGYQYIQYFDDVSGQPFTGTSRTICAVAKKNI